MQKISPKATQSEDANWFGDAAPSYVFRPVHYLGSKLRVLDSIERAIDSVDTTGGPVCDLFSGSATVSRYLSRRRQVMSVDIQEYGRVLADAVLNGDPMCREEAVKRALLTDSLMSDLCCAVAPLVKLESDAALSAIGGNLEPLCDLLDAGNLESLDMTSLTKGSPLKIATAKVRKSLDAMNLPEANTVCIRHFGGQYFSFKQSAELDALSAFARRSGNSVLLAATLSTASHLVNSIGKQFAQPIRPRDKTGKAKQHVVKKIVADRGISATTVFLNYVRQYVGLSVTRRDHVAIRADFRAALANPAIRPAVVYADPPYTRDHYSRFYHTLETIALGDDPFITTSNLGRGDVKSRGGYRSGRHQSPFCIKSEAPGAFSALFTAVANLRVPLVLSYSGYDASIEARPRVMPLDAVISLAKEHFKKVDVELLTKLDHMKLNTTSLNKAANGTTEVLLLCR